MSHNPTASPDLEPEEKPAFSKRTALIALAAFFVVAGIGGTVYYRHARQFESTDDAFIDGNITAVSAKVAGRIQQVLVEDNQEVAAGEVLVKLDPKDFQAHLAQAQAAYDAALAKLEVAKTAVDLTRANTAATLADTRAQVEAAKSTSITAEAQAASAKADVIAAEAENTRREQDLKRYESLDARVVTQQQLDNARAAVEASRATLDAARKRVAAAESAINEAQAKIRQKQALVAAAETAPQQIASAISQVHSAEAAVEQAKAAVDAAQLDLSYTTITAPSGGRLARKFAQPGQYTQVGQALMAVVEPEVWVTANFKETQITHMHAGQTVELSVDAYPGKSFKGKIQSIQGGTGARFSLLPPENATGNYVKVVQRVPVKIVFDKTGEDAGYLLAPGMSAEPAVFIGENPADHPAPIAASATQATK